MEELLEPAEVGRPHRPEGINAGCWTVVLAVSGNLLGLSLEETRRLPPAEFSARRERAAARLSACGAHALIDSVADLTPVVREFDALLAKRRTSGTRNSLWAERAIVDAGANLVAKSLVPADVSGSRAFYRLFDVTRAYALTKLGERSEPDPLARSQADYYRTALENAQTEWETSPAAEWLERYRHLIDNVRAALTWAFSPAGDPVTGVAITVGAVPQWFQLSLTSECAELVDRALATPAASRTAESEMRLYATRAW